MANDTLADQIIATLHPYAVQLRNDVATLAAGTGGTATERAWRNADGVILVYVSFDPHGNADEESVEAICSLHLRETYATFTADVENQDGEILELLVNEVEIPIQGETTETTLATVDRLGQRAYERFLNFFQMFLESHQ